MRIYTAIIFTAITCAIAFTGCKRVNGKGAIITQNYDLTGFDKVELSNQGDVVLVQDANQFVEVKTHENLFEALEIKVDGGRLEIGNKKGYSIGKYEELTYYVHMPNIIEANISGSGNITGDNMITGTHFLAKVSGSGNITMGNLNTESTEANISGSGDINLSGATLSSKLTISGSGKIAAFGLSSVDTDVNVSGSGDVETTTTGTLDINISGSGTVKYKGTPTINSNVSGSGDVINAN